MTGIIKGHGAFRRFKDTVYDFGLDKEWYEFQAEAYKRIAIKWCEENLEIQNEHYFINCNKGNNSFRDMQLMSHCKHGIVTNSTFGWWGAFFILNPNKITISPQAEINTTYYC